LNLRLPDSINPISHTLFIDISEWAAGPMKARVTIEYEVPWPDGLTVTELREREDEAWLTGAITIPDLQSVVVK
jgi:hypothetical protein